MRTYYFKVDSGYGVQYVGVVGESETGAKSDLKRLLELQHERVVCSIPRKPGGVEWQKNYRGASWAIGGMARDRR
jgi:hypothetical protein